ncbi:hypothetical protein ACR79R_08515, partial [Sphingobacterium spiritivorum]|uniref:hypothetical protein n=1 Tax=Sphingobacterium spiritivorum TaxID=258 RepID=UPI003DA47FC0
MILLNNILYLTMPELNQAGISFGTARFWKFKIKDPNDLRCDLFPYEQIKPKYQERIKNHFGDVYIYQAHQLIKQYLNPDKTAFDFFSCYTLENGEGLPEGHIEKYTTAAQWLNMLVEMLSVRSGFIKKYNMSRSQFWTSACAIIAAEGIDLPSSYKRLSEKVRNYIDRGYIEVIRDRFDKRNNQIITPEVGEWLIARYSSQVNKCRIEDLWLEYNQKAKINGWKLLKSDKSIYNFLHRPEVEYRWYAGRYGELEFKKKFGIKQKRDLPTWRDALWYSDGTKVNYYYKTASGYAAKLIVYEIIDVYSECFLGCHFAFSEDHEAQYFAYKNAIMFSMHKPHEIRYDNQGGHKTLENGDFLKRLAKISHVTQPYNGNSKSIESVFGRFQTQHLFKDWYFTGQNVTAKKQESKANMELILANVKNLLSLDQVKEQYLMRRNEWNNELHPKLGIPRIEAYQKSQNPKPYPVDYLDMIDMFWITSADHLTYYAEGIKPTIKSKEYHYEVLNSKCLPDMSFRKKYIGQKFYYRYDPADLSHIRLYIKGSQGLQFVDVAQPKVSAQTAVQCQLPGDMEHINKMIDAAKQERVDNWTALLSLQEKYGEKAEQHGLKSPKLRGISSGKKKAKKSPVKEKVPVNDLGNWFKDQSNDDYDP